MDFTIFATTQEGDSVTITCSAKKPESAQSKALKLFKELDIKIKKVTKIKVARGSTQC